MVWGANTFTETTWTQFLKFLSSTNSHHAELRLRLLNHVILLRLADTGENPRLRVVVQHVALETGEEVAEAPDAAQAHHTLADGQKEDGTQK